eukprot:COSAG05_NODE_1975_length_3765_cov_7.155756_2_plen_194_part_00
MCARRPTALLGRYSSHVRVSAGVRPQALRGGGGVVQARQGAGQDQRLPDRAGGAGDLAVQGAGTAVAVCCRRCGCVLPVPADVSPAANRLCLAAQVYEPILILGKERFEEVDIRIRCKGGGYVSQIYAIRQAIAKSLVAYFQKCAPLAPTAPSLQGTHVRGTVCTCRIGRRGRGGKEGDQGHPAAVRSVPAGA